MVAVVVVCMYGHALYILHTRTRPVIGTGLSESVVNAVTVHAHVRMRAAGRECLVQLGSPTVAERTESLRH